MTLIMDVESGTLSLSDLPPRLFGDRWYRVPEELQRSAKAAAAKNDGAVNLTGKSAIARWAAGKRRSLNRRRAAGARRRRS